MSFFSQYNMWLTKSISQLIYRTTPSGINSTILLLFQCKLILYTLTKSIPDVSLLSEIMFNIFLNGSIEL